MPTPDHVLDISLVDIGVPKGAIGFVHEPLGIEVLSGVLIKTFSNNVRLVLKSGQFIPDGVISASDCDESDIVGISAKIETWSRTEALLEGLYHGEKPFPGPIVLGDSFATFAYEYMLQRYPGLICVIGEGEEAFKGIVETFMSITKETRGDLDLLKAELGRKLVPNLAFMFHGRLITTARRPVNLNSVGLPDRKLLPEVLQRGGIAAIEMSRGCNYGRCSFCCIPGKYGSTEWRPRSDDLIIDDLIGLSDMGVIDLTLTDEDFIGSDPERVIRLCNLILAKKSEGAINPNLTFSIVSIRASSIVSQDPEMQNKLLCMLRLMTKAGFREAYVGVESGAPCALRRWKKGANVNVNSRAIGVLREAEMGFDIGFIMFDKKMTLADLKDSIAFLRANDLHTHHARMIKPMRIQFGTEMGREFASGKSEEDLRPDIDILSYPYEFDDPEVAKVYETYFKWEGMCKSLTDSLRRATRSPSEEIRLSIQPKLGLLRALDLEVLEYVMACVEGDSAVDFSPFAERRDQIIESILKTVNVHEAEGVSRT